MQGRHVTPVTDCDWCVLPLPGNTLILLQVVQTLPAADGWRDDRQTAKEQQAKRLKDGGSMEPGAAHRVITRRLFVVVFVLCQTLILPEAERLITPTQTHYRRTNRRLKEVKKEIFEG